MSVIVKGMEMPTSCASCRMAVCFADTGRAKCYATLSYIDPERGKRSYDCPLRPLPEKHGRLIDADRIIEDLRFDVENDARWLDDIDFVDKGREHIQGDKDCKQNCIYYISECETIVEAEGG